MIYQNKIQASIILLLKNGEKYIEEVLDAIFSQQFYGKYEVICIDSGSTDRTLDIVKKYNVKLTMIRSQEFNHGETRNLGAQLADIKSSFLVYLSQDATPANKYWLQNLINPMLEDSQVAGCFSRHVPRKGTSPALIRQLTQNWQTGGKEQLVKQIPSMHEYLQNRFFYNFFSNTSSAIRKCIWLNTPFKTVSFAEDALWAEEVLVKGYKIVFEPSSVVIHSHDYPLMEQFRQNFDHSYAMKKLFNPTDYNKLIYWIRSFLVIPIHVWQDWVFIYKSESCKQLLTHQKVYYQFHSIGWHISSVVGAFIGANYEKLPQSLRILFSRQETLRRK